ncbi:hypothetical protein GXW78_06565 [Roseomonas terrae]|uniref:Uncharacterized protein n=1 Tax=Neoroseomonas terrae TaxID=424799 RepID=A0ABS5EF68_9PROT|nr:hypothetical protein [Neoroseomonas terrae]MBR0649317.1 hypothetical protein [Neoroseomonas terrae]
MNTPRPPHLPKNAPEPPPEKPHPLHRPDERKEGGPDFGKADKQQENRRKTKNDAEEEREA